MSKVCNPHHRCFETMGLRTLREARTKHTEIHSHQLKDVAQPALSLGDCIWVLDKESVGTLITVDIKLCKQIRMNSMALAAAYNKTADQRMLLCIQLFLSFTPKTLRSPRKGTVVFTVVPKSFFFPLIHPVCCRAGSLPKTGWEKQVG